jgi:predicted secreted hydrolase
MDHEFGSNQLAEDQVGWDWFSIQFDQGGALMLYKIRKADGSVERHSSGTLVDPSGRQQRLTREDFVIENSGSWKSPRSGGVYPMGWRVSIPKTGLVLDLIPAFSEQELDTRRSTRVVYWEGSVRVQGHRSGEKVGGMGYVEMTGYAQKFDQRL